DALSDASTNDAAIDATPDASTDADAATPDLGAPEPIDFGSVTAGTPSELSVPGGALGFHVVVRRPAGGLVGSERITSPSAQDVVTDFTVANFHSPTLMGASGVAAASVPQNALAPAMPLEPGTWKIQFGGAPSGEPLTAKAWIQKTNDGAFHGGVLDLVVYVPAGLELTDGAPSQVVDATSAGTHPGIQTRIDTFFDALGSLYGISRGEVRFVDLGGEHRLIAVPAGLDAALSATVPAESATA